MSMGSIISIILESGKKRKECVEAIKKQSYAAWELFIIGSDYAYSDPRIHSMGDMSIEDAGKRLDGDYVLILRDGDILARDALSDFNSFAEKYTAAEAVYADEEGLAKPDFSPDALLCTNYIASPFFVSSRLFRKLSHGIDFTPERLYDYTLKVCDKARHVLHLEKALLIREQSAWDLNLSTIAPIIEDSLRRNGRSGIVVPGLYEGSFRVHYPVRSGFTSDIVLYGIETADELRDWLEYTEDITCGKGYSFTVCAQGVEDMKLRRYLTALSNSDASRVLTFGADEKLSVMLNRCTKDADGEALLFCDCAYTPTLPDWIEALAELCVQERAGTVSPLIITPDGKIAEAGNEAGKDGFWSTPYFGEQRTYDDFSFNFRINTIRDVLLGNFGCFMVKRDVFDAVGGFDTSFYGKAAIADLHIRLHNQGYRNIYTPYSVLHGQAEEYNQPDEKDRVRAYDVMREYLKN